MIAIRNVRVLSMLLGLCVATGCAAMNGQYTFPDAATLNKKVEKHLFWSPDVRTRAIQKVAGKTLTREQVESEVQSAMNEILMESEIYSLDPQFYSVENMANALIKAAR